MKNSKIFLFLLAGWVIFPWCVSAGTISGKVVFSGTAPERAALEIKGDPTCLEAHDGPVLSEKMVINENQTLRNVFIYVKSGLSGHFEAPTEAVTLDQQGCMYRPHVFGLMIGQPLEMTNQDDTLHNVRGIPQNQRQFNIGMPMPGIKIRKVFKAAEWPIRFKCDVHPWMSAYGFVLPHPFFHVSGEEGLYAIGDLPAGTYTLEAWHEELGVQTQTITVRGDEVVEVDFEFSA